MGNLMFSPSGRIGPSAYMKGMLIIGAIAALVNLLLFVNVGLAIVISILGLLFYVVVIMMGIKRSHDAGKSGWMSITHLLLLIGVGAALGLVLNAIGMGVDDAAITAAGESGDLSAVMAATGEAMKAAAIPGAISSFLSFAITAFLVNMFNKQDMGDNQYGPVPLA